MYIDMYDVDRGIHVYSNYGTSYLLLYTGILDVSNIKFTSSAVKQVTYRYIALPISGISEDSDAG